MTHKVVRLETNVREFKEPVVLSKVRAQKKQPKSELRSAELADVIPIGNPYRTATKLYEPPIKVCKHRRNWNWEIVAVFFLVIGTIAAYLHGGTEFAASFAIGFAAIQLIDSCRRR